MKKIHRPELETTVSEKDSFFSFQKLTACVSTNCSESHVMSDTEAMKRRYSESEVDSEGTTVDESTSETFSEGCSSNQRKIKKLKNDHNPNDVSKKLNDSGLHNMSLNMSEVDSDIYQQLVLFSQNDLSDIITTMLKPDFELNVVLDEIKINSNCLLIFMKIMSVVCKSNSALKIEILLTVSKSSLLNSIRCFLQKIIDDPNPTSSTTVIMTFFNHIIEFYSSVFILLPEMMIDMNLKEIVVATIQACEKFENCDSETFLLRFKLTDLLVKVESYPVKLSQITTPVADFRTCSLYPTSENLESPLAYSVEANLTKGMYVDLEHYVSTQFHLLRECFHLPIKTAVRDFSNSAITPNNHFWTNVTFRQVIFCSKTMCFEITFKNSVVKPSAYLAYGSLVIFSDNIFQTFFFGVVEEWNTSGASAIVTLLHEPEVPPPQVFGSEFAMLDTAINLLQFNYPAFMKALINKTTNGFPLIKYLINAEIDSPSVMPMDRKHRLNAVLCLDSNDKLMKFVDATLDFSQFIALKSALTDPVTLIAGSRGTGKTLLAGKIIQVLLHGQGMKNTIKRLPILMICRSNEALDEFLNITCSWTHKIVRIGGHTSNSHLKSYNLRSLRRGNVSVAVQKITLFKLQRQIKNVATEIRTLCEYPGVLSFNLLKNVMVERHKCNLDEERLLELLLDDEGFTFDYVKPLGSMGERLGASILDELDRSKAYLGCTEVVKSVPLNVSSNRSATADEFFVDEDIDSGGSSEVEDNLINDISYAITVQEYTNVYQHNVQELESRFSKLSSYAELKGDMYFEVEHIQMLRRRLHILKTEIENLSLTPRLNSETCIALQQKDFSSLTFNERWMMYEFWVCQLRTHYINKFHNLVRTYLEELNEFDRLLDLEVLSQAEIVGVTTTCLAKFLPYFEHLQPSVVIVEEATEIIEAEIVAPLSLACDQLILLGDLHSMKPLTPNTNFSKMHSMDVSLFERLMNNGFKCHQLKIQRTIPPEINSILRSTFVTDLYRDVVHNGATSILKVKGFDKNVFFLNTHLEEKNDDVSAVNFILRMCLYLMKQNVSSNEITILSVDVEQSYVLRETLNQTSNSLLKAIEVGTIENFRSKTNNIILLSFVNCGSKLMDRDDKNRLFYTALTRATQALYMIGDVEQLSRYFHLWPSVLENLQKWNAFGNKIILVCEKHQKFGAVAVTDDFWTGCGEVCGDVLPCRHSCPFLCHVDDTEHTKRYICHAKTSLQCSSGHTYQKKCGAGHQTCPVEITIPSRYCGHSITKKCGDFVYSTSCTQICNQLLSCGHKCSEICHRLSDPMHRKVRCKAPCGKIHADCTRGHVCTKPCSQRCGICLEVDSCLLECGHKSTVLCSFDVSRVKCYEKCSKICAVCGERCQKYCFEDCQPCTNKVMKIIEGCGHEKMMECGILPESNCCKDECEILPECNCCKEMITLSPVTIPCGHNQIYIPCSLRNKDPAKLSSYCSATCGATLMCGHLCRGTCGSCFQQRIHTGCSDQCDSIFVCGHRCKSLCENVHELALCEESCTYYCQHQKCNAECGVPCIPCKGICEWKCKHSVCTRTCSEICDRSACYEPCDQNLPCGHPCIGFCGEPCPPLCGVCNHEYLAVNYPNAVNNPQTRFVLLADCQHVVESRSLEEYLYKSSLVALKTCPYPCCEKPIFSTLRYRNLVKQYYQHVKNIKKIYLMDDDPTVRELTEAIDKKMYNIWILFYLTDMNLAVNDVERAFNRCLHEKKNRRSEIPWLQSLSYYADLMLDVGSRYPNWAGAKYSKSFPELLSIAEEVHQCVTNIMRSLKIHVEKISIELVDDLYCEVNRFHKMVDFCLITKFGARTEARQMFTAFQNIFRAPGKYTDERNNQVNNLMRELQEILQCSIPPAALTPRNVQKTQTIKSKLLNEKRGLWYVCKTGHYYRTTEHHDWSTANACPYCSAPEIDVGDENDSSDSFIAVLNAV